MKWHPLAWALLAVFAVVCERLHAVAASADVTLHTRANSLSTHSANLDRIALSARFALLQQYDSVVDSEKMINNEIKEFKDSKPPFVVATALTSFEKSFQARQADLVMLKADRGLLTNTERYVPKLLDDLHKSNPADPRVSEAISAVLAWEMASDDDDTTLHRLQEFTDGLREAAGGDPMAAVVPHLDALVSTRRALVAITRDQLVKAPLGVASNDVVKAVGVVVADHQARAQKARLAILGLAVALTLATLWIDRR